MKIRRKIAIVIPARNEEESLPSVLERTPSLEQFFESRVFVVDDGSQDNTAKVARERGAEVIRHPVSLGIGGALKTGFLLAKEWGAHIIVQLDADGEHDPAELHQLLNPVLSGKADMAVGSRLMNGDPPLSLVRKMGIRFYTWLVNKLTGYRLTDVTSGYRVFKGEIVDKVMFPSEGHWAIEMTLLAGKHGVNIVEVPIRANNRENGRSQFQELMVFVLYPLRAMKQIIDAYL